MVLLLLNLRSTQAEDFAIDWYTLDGGGGTSSGGAYTLSGTIGQPDAGQLSSGSYTLDGGFWGGILAGPPAGAPTLHIEKNGINYLISWSPNTAGFVLQFSDSLSGPAWTNAPSDGVNPAAVSPGGATRFYLGAVLVSSMTCWKVGRFWNGNGGTEYPLAVVQRFMSKQLASGSSAHAPCP